MQCNEIIIYMIHACSIYLFGTQFVGTPALRTMSSLDPLVLQRQANECVLRNLHIIEIFTTFIAPPYPTVRAPCCCILLSFPQIFHLQSSIEEYQRSMDYWSIYDSDHSPRRSLQDELCIAWSRHSI